MNCWNFFKPAALTASLLGLLSTTFLAADELLVDPALRSALVTALEEPHQFEDEFDAQVWLLSRRNALQRFIEEPDRAIPLLQTIHRHASQAGLDPDLVLALIEVESGFNRFAVSRAGAQGLMQVMSFWKNELGREIDNLTEIETNLRYGCAILAYYLNMENGNVRPALARYNGSYGQQWYPDRVYQAWANWR